MQPQVLHRQNTLNEESREVTDFKQVLWNILFVLSVNQIPNKAATVKWEPIKQTSEISIFRGGYNEVFGAVL